MSLAAIRTIGGGGGGGGGGGLPFEIDWAYAYWVEDPNWTPPSDGVAASSWPDYMGDASADLIAPSSPNEGLLYDDSTTAFNNRPTLQGSQVGGNRYMRTASQLTLISQPNTVVVVGSFLKIGSGAAFMFDGRDDSGFANRHIALVPVTPNEYRLFAGSFAAGGTSDTDPHLFVFRFNGSSSSIKVDGVTVASGLNPGSAGLRGFTVGCNVALGSDTLNGGRYAFIGVYDGDLSSSDETDVEVWAADHYGLTI
jgi:hypothetical protein